MKAVSKFSTPADRFTFSGTMFYYFRKMPLALDAFRKANDSLFTDSRLASSVKKILKFTAQVEFCQAN
jgi:hypothetical protein